VLPIARNVGVLRDAARPDDADTQCFRHGSPPSRCRFRRVRERLGRGRESIIGGSERPAGLSLSVVTPCILCYTLCVLLII
jgi:hypothetical protein